MKHFQLSLTVKDLHNYKGVPYESHMKKHVSGQPSHFAGWQTRYHQYNDLYRIGYEDSLMKVFGLKRLVLAHSHGHRADEIHPIRNEQAKGRRTEYSPVRYEHNLWIIGRPYTKPVRDGNHHPHIPRWHPEWKGADSPWASDEFGVYELWFAGRRLLGLLMLVSQKPGGMWRYDNLCSLVHLHEILQPSCMIAVAMRDEYIINATKVFPKPLSITDKHVTGSRIKQDAVSIRLQKDR